MPIQDLINCVINEDTTYARQPLEFKNQRTYAVKSGVNGLLDVARTMYKEATEDVYQHYTELGRKSPRTMLCQRSKLTLRRGYRDPVRSEVRE